MKNIISFRYFWRFHTLCCIGGRNWMKWRKYLFIQILFYSIIEHDLVALYSLVAAFISQFDLNGGEIFEIYIICFMFIWFMLTNIHRSSFMRSRVSPHRGNCAIHVISRHFNWNIHCRCTLQWASSMKYFRMVSHSIEICIWYEFRSGLGLGCTASHIVADRSEVEYASYTPFGDKLGYNLVVWWSAIDHNRLERIYLCWPFGFFLVGIESNQTRIKVFFCLWPTIWKRWNLTWISKAIYNWIAVFFFFSFTIFYWERVYVHVCYIV